MAAASTQTLLGFGADLDWRPTPFVDPFPLTKLCSVCGLLPSTLATLPCRHLLCELCHTRSMLKHGHCPLDMMKFEDGSVVWSKTCRDSILDRRTRCWNADNGCDAEDTVRAMLEHFSNACVFHMHVVHCPRCGEKVPHRDIVDHVEAGCEEPCRREQLVDHNLVDAVLEVKEALRKISRENFRLHKKLDLFEVDALSHTVADAVKMVVETTISTCRAETDATLCEHRLEVCAQVKEAMAGNEQTIRRVLSHECERQLQAFKQKVAELVSEGNNTINAALALLAKEAEEKNFKEGGETRSMELLAAVSLCIQSDVLNMSLPYEWRINGWAAFCAHKDESREYFSCAQGEARYYFGYLIVPQLCFSPIGNCIWFRICVIKGLFDKLLKWPMEKKLKVCFVHPVSAQNNAVLTSGLEWRPRTDSCPLGVEKELVCTGFSTTMPVEAFRLGHFFVNCDHLSLQLNFVS